MNAMCGCQSSNQNSTSAHVFIIRRSQLFRNNKMTLVHRMAKEPSSKNKTENQKKNNRIGWRNGKRQKKNTRKNIECAEKV